MLAATLGDTANLKQRFNNKIINSMATKISTLLTAFTFAITSSFAQTADDNITFLKVQNQIDLGNYYKALDILSTISSQGKNSSFYFSYSATCYEKTYQFDKAASTYRQLYNKTNSFDAMKKVAEMEEYQENKLKVYQVDSVIRSKATALGTYKFRFKDDAVDKLVIIGKVGDEGFIIGIWSLPSFRYNTLVTCDGKLHKNENTGRDEYSFFGKYQQRFGDNTECAKFNKDLPESTYYGTLNSYFNEMTLLIFSYDCPKRQDGTPYLRKRDDSSPELWELTKISDFTLR